MAGLVLSSITANAGMVAPKLSNGMELEMKFLPEADLEPEFVSLRPLFMPDAIQPPKWIANAMTYVPAEDQPMIAIVIDDMGLDIKRSRRAIDLPAPVTLSWLPYASNLPEQVSTARAEGHEQMVHIPMEPESAKENPGPGALLTGMEKKELRERIRKNLAAFDGYVGINNHMGSKFTQQAPQMAVVMEELKKRSLMFLDSRTAADSKAESVAVDHEVPATHRDVFLDDTATPEAVVKSLELLEGVARRRGMAVAIGHPKDVTLSALEKWIPEARAKGFQLVPITTIVRYQDRRFDIAGLR